MKGKVTVDQINKLRDKLVYRSEKVEDRERDPHKLLEVLRKVQRYLIHHSDRMPLIHTVYKTEDLKEETGFIMIDNICAHIEGDLYHYDNYSKIRNKIHLKSYYEDFGKIDLFHDVNATIEIDHITYFTKSITKAEQFENQFENCYHFLELAIKKGKNVLWEYG